MYTIVYYIQNYLLFSGLVILSTFTTFFLFWFLHVSHVFTSLAFPFKYNIWMSSKKTTRRAYVTEMVLVAMCGVLPSIVIVFTNGYQFRLGFPPFCAPTNIDVLFSIVLVPLALGSAVGLSLLFSSFWILHKVSICMYTVCTCTRAIRNY